MGTAHPAGVVDVRERALDPFWNIPSRVWLPLLAVLMGAGNGIVLAGWEAINPKNTTWLFGDTATYYVGWALYRYDPHLHFPLAWTERVGYPVGTSIALLDPIPLAAILLRPLSPILPEPFQYLGLYLVLCFVLQAYSGCGSASGSFHRIQRWPQSGAYSFSFLRL